MRTFTCVCGNRLFFENTHCLACQRDVGWCPVCRSISALLAEGGVRFVCGNESCRAGLIKCRNYLIEDICNRCISAPPEDRPTTSPLCDWCRLTAVIPDLSVPGNRQKWYRLEVAKRRLLYLLDLLALPYSGAAPGPSPPLSFDFKADSVPRDGVWRMMTAERVYTGHQDGKITINIREADDVEREKLRVDLREAHRTLAGHFRHEIGHYFWQVLIAGQHEAEFIDRFGDYRNPPYSAALEAYYRDGPPADWQARFVSAYSAMHPWEDFAETFALYLDIADVLDTASHNELAGGLDVQSLDAEEMIATYLELGVAANELNRSMGLIDLVPEVLTPAVCEKLAFVHERVTSARENLALCAGATSA
jgi:hypothetical protein